MQEKFMKEALKEAKKAYEKLEVPVGCVIVKDNKIIARGHNVKETKRDTRQIFIEDNETYETYPFHEIHYHPYFARISRFVFLI